MREKSKAAYMISSVAEQYGVHPQTLRLYEREGLLKPSRSDGNTRLYTDEDLERLEVILHLTRDLGVNLAGVEIILNMRARRWRAMQQQIEEFVESLNHELANRPRPEQPGRPQFADPGRADHLDPPPRLKLAVQIEHGFQILFDRRFRNPGQLRFRKLPVDCVFKPVDVPRRKQRHPGRPHPVVRSNRPEG